MFKLPSSKKLLLDACFRLGAGHAEPGFVRFEINYRKKVNAFYNKSLGIVLKRPAFIMNRRTPMALRCNTINLGHGWVCQPLIKRNSLKRAELILKRKLKACGICCDLHTGNIGWHKNKAVLLDW